MECIGTLFLAIMISFTGNPIAIGLILASMIYIGGHISGGHFNPGLSLAAYIRGTLTREDFFIYSAAQTLGALIALILHKIISGNIFTPDALPDIPLWISLLMEGMLAFVLCAVFLTVTSVNKFKGNNFYGFAIGLALMSIVIVGGIFNPAVALGSFLLNLFAGSLSFPVIEFIIIYIAGPLLGGVGAAYFVDYINTPEK